MTILSMRSFAGAKRVFDSTKKAIDLPRTRSMEIFTDIMFDAADEDREAYKEEKERIAREAERETSSDTESGSGE